MESCHPNMSMRACHCMRYQITFNVVIATAALMFAGLSHAEQVSIDCPSPVASMSLRWDGQTYVLAENYAGAPVTDMRKVVKFKMFNLAETKDSVILSFQHEPMDSTVSYVSFHITTANRQAYRSKGANAVVIKSSAVMGDGMLWLTSNFDWKGCAYSIVE